MKVFFLEVGINENGVTGPIFEDGSFEFIPPRAPSADTNRTYSNLIGCFNQTLATYLPIRYQYAKTLMNPYHNFSYFSFTERELLDLEAGDLIVLYSHLTPFNNQRYEKGLYIIGYITVNTVVEIGGIPGKLCEMKTRRYLKVNPNMDKYRDYDVKDAIFVYPFTMKSKLLDKAVAITIEDVESFSTDDHSISKKRAFQVHRDLRSSVTVQHSRAYHYFDLIDI